jgi:hypothetical protein
MRWLWTRRGLTFSIGAGVPQDCTRQARPIRQPSKAIPHSLEQGSYGKSRSPTSVVCLFGLSCRIGAGRLNGDADMVFRTMMTMLFALSWPSPLITSWSAAHSVVKSGLNAFVELVGMGWPLQLGSAVLLSGGFALGSGYVGITGNASTPSPS